MVGYLDITLGCMFSGKTKKLIQTFHKYAHKDIVAINYYLDTRYGESGIYTHDGEYIPCLMIDNLFEAWFNKNHDCHDTLENNTYILINEAQFFNNLFDVVCSMIKCGKKVFIYGLDGDFQQNKFGEIFDLIPYCDTIEKLRANCNYCENLAIFSKRIEENNDQILIGNNNYIPLCRKCFNTPYDLDTIISVD